MFGFDKDIEFALKKKIADLERELAFEKYERSSDNSRLTSQLELTAINKRLENINAKLEAQAEAKYSKEYADKSVAMASKVAADFGNAIGKSYEQLLAALKEFKPTPAQLTVLPQTPVTVQASR